MSKLEIRPLKLNGTLEITTNSFSDHRGVFARWFCAEEMSHVLDERKIVNVNYSKTIQKGSVRGLHFQKPPMAEMKIVRCVNGVVLDVFVDIRKESPTFLHWDAIELDAQKMNMVVIPEGFAHGFQSLTDNVEFLYLTTQYYSPECEGALHVNDPDLGIDWPIPITDISQKDKENPYSNSAEFSPVNMGMS